MWVQWASHTSAVTEANPMPLGMRRQTWQRRGKDLCEIFEEEKEKGGTGKRRKGQKSNGGREGRRTWKNMKEGREGEQGKGSGANTLF